MNIASELILIPGDPKYHFILPVTVGTYGHQVINGILTQVHLRMDLVSHRTHPVVSIFPVLEYIIGIVILSSR